MKASHFLIAALAALSLQAQASEEDSAQWCLEFAKARVAKYAGKKVADVKFHSSAILGDGINAFEVDAFQVNGLGGLVKVDTLIDGCEPMGAVVRINN